MVNQGLILASPHRPDARPVEAKARPARIDPGKSTA
jgi:hypothetical protein